MRVRTLEQAAAWVDDVGAGFLFPNGDYVLPSLWEAVAGHPLMEWGVQRDDGKWEFTPETAKGWSWKDELPARRLACVGLHVAHHRARRARARPGRLRAHGGVALDGLERELADAALSLRRPATRRELRLLVGADKRTGDRAVNAPQRKLVLTNAGLDTEGSGWGATLHDVFARRWRQKLGRVPAREDALASLAVAVVRSAGKVSAADLAAALKVRRREAAETLERLEAKGEVTPARRDDLLLWSTRARESSARSRAAGSRSSPRRSR